MFQHLCVWARHDGVWDVLLLSHVVTLVRTDVTYAANGLQEFFQVTRKNHVTGESAASVLSPQDDGALSVDGL